MKEIGNRIKRLRESVPGRTQEDFGRPLGVTRGAVNNWERGKGISRVNIGKIAQHYNVGVSWLMSGPDEGPIPFIEPAIPELPVLPTGAWAIALDETLRVAGLTPPVAAELVAMIEQVAAASPPAFPSLSAEETTRLLVRQLAALILAKPRGPTG